MSNSFADIIEKASPSVVNIQSTRVIKASEQAGQQPIYVPIRSSGSFSEATARVAAIANPAPERRVRAWFRRHRRPIGYILTNNHVVDKATTVKVTFLTNASSRPKSWVRTRRPM